MTSTNTCQLSEVITRKSSLQTYFTVKLLVDKPRQQNCFSAYAYFRWLDDQIDLECKTKAERLHVIARQKQIIEAAYQNQHIDIHCPQEQMIIELINSDRQKNSKLGSFILNFFAIIEFDAHRKDNLVSQKKLSWYPETLSKAVTDGIEYFINHDSEYPESKDQYRAAQAAHLIHMLRDYREDVPQGFINIPKEYLLTHKLNPTDIHQPLFKSWVEQQIMIAENHFRAGKKYIHRLPVLRGKIAATWYCIRFENCLNEIKKDQYLLRAVYPHHGKLSNYVKMIEVALQVTGLIT